MTAHLAARACLPRRRARRDAPPRIRDARMVSRRGIVPRPDGGMRGAAARRPERGRRRRAAPGAAIGPTPRLPLAAAYASPRRFPRYAGIDLLATAPDPQHPDAALLAAAACAASGSRRIQATIGRRCSSAFFSSASSRISGSARRRSFTIIRSRWPRCRAANPTTRGWPSASSCMSAASNSPTRSAS